MNYIDGKEQNRIFKFFLKYEFVGIALLFTSGI